MRARNASLFLLPGILGTLVGLYLFRSDYISPHRAPHGEKYGEVRFVRGDVKHRPATSYLWSAVRLGQEVYSGDAIQTGPKSVAHLQLTRGDGLTIESNTMIIFDEKLGLTRATPRPGTTVYQSAEGSKSGASAPPAPDLTSQKENPMTEGLDLVSPLHHQFYVDTPTPFLFQWRRDPIADRAGNRYRLEVARDVKFEKPLVSLLTTDDMVASDTVGLEPGSYYWRVRIIDLRGNAVKTTRTIPFAYGLSPALKHDPNANRDPGRLPSSDR